MKAVYKYLIPAVDNPTILLPEFAEVLQVEAISSDLWLWALVDVNAPLVDTKFIVRGTGHLIMDDLSNSLEYINTALMYEGSLVWHIFKVKDNG